jgi:lysophospholipase L1-like esterase
MGKSRTIKYRILFRVLLLGLIVGVAGCAHPVYVAVGDSITKGIGDNDLANGRGFPPLLKVALGSSNLTIENAGKPGETSGGGASRIGVVLRQYSNASVVFVQYGTNDARASPPVSTNDFKSNMQKIITAVKNAGARPLLAKIPSGYTGSGSMRPPCDDSSASAKAFDQRIRDYNQAISELVSSNSLENPAGGRFVPPDFYTNFKRTRVENSTGKSVEFDDCFHPNDEGYQSMARWWSYALEIPIKWAYRTGDAVGADGMIYVGSGDHNLYAIQHDLRSTPSSSAPWPMFHHDRKHSGRQQ